MKYLVLQIILTDPYVFMKFKPFNLVITSKGVIWNRSWMMTDEDAGLTDYFNVIRGIKVVL